MLGSEELQLDKAELGKTEFPNTVWQCCMKRLLPSKWPCLNGVVSRGGGHQLLKGCQLGLLAVVGLLSNMMSYGDHFTHKCISVPC